MLMQLPQFYKHHDRSQLDSVYEALGNKDLAECVMVAVRVLKETDNFLKFEKREKSATEALELGVKGKEALIKGEYQKALVLFNNALMRAPANSKAMIFSYYHRAGLLLTTKQFQACVKDIETCLALNCPENLVGKLLEMKANASKYTWIEFVAQKQRSTLFTEQFFTLKGGRNPDIPCATSDVEVIMESGKPKVVAAKDIPIGTVLAVETSFIAATHIYGNATSCHYCLKMNFNLIPCEGCCAVMFCDKQCKEKAMQEGHIVECKIIEILLDDINLPVKATLKIRQLCNSWDEFITASNDLGTDRMKNSAMEEIFGSNKFSLLNSQYDTHFIYGAMFNRCMYFANIIHYLDILTSFLPDSLEERSAAKRAMSRVMMHLSLYCTSVKMLQVTSLCTESELRMHSSDKGYFQFFGNLTNSCLPNSYVVGLQKSAALITIEPIQKGAELTYSYIGHWLNVTTPGSQETPQKRAQNLFRFYRTVCKDCFICGGGAAKIFCKQPLNAAQKEAFKSFSPHFAPPNIQKPYMVACNTLKALREVPCSEEYYAAFVLFIQCLMHCVFYNFPNVCYMIMSGL